MKIVVLNLAGVKVEKDKSFRHYAKAGSRWPMTVGYTRSVDYYPFPFWLAYTTSLLKKETRAAVKGIDGVAMDMAADELLAVVKRADPNLVITELTTIALGEDLELLRQIKANTGAQVAVCGHYATVYPERILRENSFIDFALVGEYEITARELVLCLDDQRFTGKVKGLAYRERGEIKVNERRKLLADLDTLPYPDREDFPPTIYLDFTLISPSVSLVASRGCPVGCIFCIERHVIYASPRYRMRNPRNVVDEVEFCIEKFGARQLYFDDQSLTVNKKHVQEICDEILRRGIKISWTCMGDAMFVDYTTLRKMREAGCVGMKFGVESAEPAILKRIDKPLDLKKAKQVVKWCRELGIRTHATFCIGLPGDDRESILKTMKFADELGADTSQVSKAIPYPGTPFYEWSKENGYLLTDDLSKYDGAEKAILSYPNLSNTELDELYRVFARKVSRRKLLRYLSEPGHSFSIVRELCYRKGLRSVLGSARTFIKRAM